MTTRQYSSRSQQTTLTAPLSATATSMTVVNATTLLGGQTIPGGRTFTLVLDPDTSLEEIVDATVVSGNTITITRAIDGSSGQEHSTGAVVRHMAIGRDFRDANLHAEADAAYTDGAGVSHTMHGINTTGGVVVGTSQTQTLSNKTLTTPTINGATLTGTVTAANVTFTGPVTVSGGGTLSGSFTSSTATFSSPTLTTPTINGSTLTGTTTANGATITGPVTVSGGGTLSGTWTSSAATFNSPTLSTATISGGGTLSGTFTSSAATFSSPTITNPTLSGANWTMSFSAQTTTAYTFALANAGQLVTGNTSAAQTYTIPTNAQTAFPTGTMIHVQKLGAGNITIQGTSGVTVTSSGTVTAAPVIGVQYRVATCLKTATDSWTVYGGIQ